MEMDGDLGLCPYKAATFSTYIVIYSESSANILSL